MSNPQCFTSCFNISHCISYRFRNVVIPLKMHEQVYLWSRTGWTISSLDGNYWHRTLSHVSWKNGEPQKITKLWSTMWIFVGLSSKKLYHCYSGLFMNSEPSSSRIEGHWDSELNIERKCSVTFFVDILKVIVLSSRWWLWSWCYLGNWIDILNIIFITIVKMIF